MEIYVRNNDGFVLNSYQFNRSFPVGIDNKNMYAEEDYTVYNITDVPNDPERKYYFKYYYYRDGVFELNYIPEVRQIKMEIERLKSELSSTDYKIIKSYEAVMTGETTEYNISEIHSIRQKYRDKINELESYINI